MKDDYFSMNGAAGTVQAVFANAGLDEVCVICPRWSPGKVVLQATKNKDKVELTYAATGNFVCQVRYRPRMRVVNFLEEVLVNFDDLVPGRRSVLVAVLFGQSEMLEEHWQLNISSFFGPSKSETALSSNEIEERVAKAQIAAAPKKARRKVFKKPAVLKKPAVAKK